MDLKDRWLWGRWSNWWTSGRCQPMTLLVTKHPRSSHENREGSGALIGHAQNDRPFRRAQSQLLRKRRWQRRWQKALSPAPKAKAVLVNGTILPATNLGHRPELDAKSAGLGQFPSLVPPGQIKGINLIVLWTGPQSGLTQAATRKLVILSLCVRGSGMSLETIISFCVKK